MAMSKAELEAQIAVLQARAFRAKDTLEYLAIHAERRALINLLEKRFPSKSRRSGPSPRAKVPAAKVKAWLKAHVAAWKGVAYPSEKALRAQAEDELGGHIERDKVFRPFLRDPKIVPPAWRRVGRRRKGPPKIG
jgi:hypothetical protein